ncbi:DUF11 domain-containing protein [Nesterenkonia alba]|uniref:DUF11 domain-containing protein n=1 Tax=Nesterenkonia alba TaxID=515814 RepID=UPI0003B5B0A0|nr:DUF11 domain-containing protein [Nesterenkonia alba]
MCDSSAFGVSALASGQSATITLYARLSPDYDGNGLDLEQLVTPGSDYIDDDASTHSNGFVDGEEHEGALLLNERESDLEIHKQLDTVTNSSGQPIGEDYGATPGQMLDYTVTVVNNGLSSVLPSDIYTVTDVLPPNVSLVWASGDYETETITNEDDEEQTVITWEVTGPLAPNLPTNFYYRTQLDTDAVDGDLVRNEVEVEHEHDPNDDNNEDYVQIEVGTATADVGISKQVQLTDEQESDGVRPGETFDYLFEVNNRGPSTAQNVEITDPLPPGLEIVEIEGRYCRESEENQGEVHCDIGAMDPGIRNFLVTVRLSPDASADEYPNAQDIPNTATVSWDNPPADDDGSDEDSSSFALGDAQSDLSLSKSTFIDGNRVNTTDGLVKPGEHADFDLTVTNNGPSTATGVQVVDILPQDMTFNNEAYLEGQLLDDDACEIESVTVNGETREQVTCEIGDIAEGDSVTLRISATLDSGFEPEGDGEGGDYLVNEASVDMDYEDPNPDNNTDTSNMPLGEPAAWLGITKQRQNTEQIQPGQTFWYDIEVTNYGPSDARDLVIEEQLPSALAKVPGTATVDGDAPGERPGWDGCVGEEGDAPGAYGARLLCPVGDLPAGEAMTFSIEVRLDQNYTGSGTDIINAAAVTSTTSGYEEAPDDAPGGIGQRVETTPVPSDQLGLGESQLTLGKDAAESTGIAGEYKTFTLEITNNAPAEDSEDEFAIARNVVLTDTLPEGMTYRNHGGAECSVSTNDDGRQVVTCEVGDLQVGQSAQVRIAANVDPSVPAGTTLTNEAEITHDGDIAADSVMEDTFGVTISTRADVSFNTITPQSLNVGGDSNYHVQLRNTGPSDAQNVTVEYTIPADDEHMRFVDDDRFLREGCSVSNEGRTITCEIGTLPAGESISFPIRVSLTPDTPEDYTPELSGRGTSDTPMASGETDDDGNPAFGTTIQNEGIPVSVLTDIEVSKSADQDEQVRAGDTFDYSITVSNLGPADAQNVITSDDLPGGLRLEGIVDQDGNSVDVYTDLGEDEEEEISLPSAYGETVEWSAGTVPANSERTYTLTVRVDPAKLDDGSTVRNLVNVETETTESRYINNNASAALPGGSLLTPQAELTLDKRLSNGPAGDSTGPVTPGTTFWYELEVENDGPSAAMNPRVIDTLPSAVQFVGIHDDPDIAPVAQGWRGQANGNTVVFTYDGAYGPDQSDTLFVQVRLDPAYTGDGSDLTNVATVTSDTQNPDGTTESTSGEAVGLPGGPGTPEAEVVLSKSLQPLPGEEYVVPGGLAQVFFSVENRGPSTATGIVITDELPDTLAYHSGAGCSGTAETFGGTVTCDDLGSIAPGGRAEAYFQVRISPDWDPENDPAIENTASATIFTGTDHEEDVDSTDPYPDEDDPQPRSPATFGEGVLGNATADLEIDKSVDMDSLSDGEVIPGEQFDFELTVTNHGPSTARNVSITDTLPAELTWVSGGSHSNGEVTFDLGTMALNATETVTVTVELDPNYDGDGSDVENSATVETTATDPVEDNDTASSTIPAGQPWADISITKTALGDAVAPGEEFTYEVEVTNNGPSTAHSVSIVDTLPNELGFVSSEECDGSDQRFGGEVICPVVESLSPNGTITHEITVVLDPDYAGSGTEIQNRVDVEARTSDFVTSNNHAIEGLPAGGEAAAASADLSIDKTMEPVNDDDQVVPGGNVLVTLVVTNDGPSTATGVRITDELPANLAFVSSEDGSYSTVDNQVSFVPDGPLASGESITKTFIAQLNSDFTGDGSDVVNEAEVTAWTADPDTSNNTDDDDLSGQVGDAQADLAITKSTSSTEVTPGTSVDFDLTVTNHGPSTARDVTVTDELPDELTVTDTYVYDNAGECTEENGDVVCDLDDMANGAEVRITVTATLDAGYAGDGRDVINVATVDADTDDPNDTNDVAEAYVPAGDAQADLAIDKNVLGDDEPVAPGETFEYELTIENNGPSTAHQVVVRDQLPAVLALVDVIEADGYTHSGGSAYGEEHVFQRDEPMASGGEDTIVLEVRLDPSYTGGGSDIQNTATVTAQTFDPNPTNNQAGAPLSGGEAGLPEAELELVKEFLGDGEIAPGETVDVALTVTNNGPSTARNVEVTDDLPNELRFAGSLEGCESTTEGRGYGETVTCPTIPTLAVDESRTKTITVQLNPNYTGDGADILNEASADSDATDQPATAEADLDGRISGPVADLWLDKSIDLGSMHADDVTEDGNPVLLPGRGLTYVITVTNDGPSDAGNEIVVQDRLPEALEIHSQPGLPTNCEVTTDADGELIECEISDLAAGASTTIEIPVLLPANFAGFERGDLDLEDLDEDFVEALEELVNTATITEDSALNNGDPDLTNNDDAVGVPVGAPLADLEIEKAPLNASEEDGEWVFSSTDLQPIAPGEMFGYEITVTNHGPSEADGIVIEDELPDHLQFIAAAPNNPVDLAGDEADYGGYGEPVTFDEYDDLASGDSVTVRIVVQLHPSYSGSADGVVNIATVDAATADFSTLNNRATAGLPTDAVAQPHSTVGFGTPEVTAADDNGNAISGDVTPGNRANVTIPVVNDGPSTARNVTVTFPIPPGMSYDVPDGWEYPEGVTCSEVDGTVVCVIAELSPEEDLDLTIPLRVNPDYLPDEDTPGLVSTPSVSGPTVTQRTDDDGNPEAPQVSFNDLVGPPHSELSVDSSVTTPDGQPAAPGQQIHHTVTVHNDGPSTARNVEVTFPWSPELEKLSSTGECTIDDEAGTITCIIDEIPPGQSATITIVSQIDPSYEGDGTDLYTGPVTATAYDQDGNPTSDPATDDINLVEVDGALVGSGSADLAITKAPIGTEPVTPGTTFSYELVVTNDGPSTAREITVTDELPSQLRLEHVQKTVRETADADSDVLFEEECADGGDYGVTIECDIPQMEPGHVATIEVEVYLDPAYTGDGTDIVNLGRVTAETYDPMLSNNSTTAGVPSGMTGRPAADLGITKTHDYGEEIIPGETFDATISVTNYGPSVAPDVVVTDELPNELQVIEVTPETGECSTGRSTLECELGTLGLNETVTIDVVLQLDPSYTGDGDGVSNVARVEGAVYDPEGSNDADEAFLGHRDEDADDGEDNWVSHVADPQADLEIDKTTDATDVAPGDEFDFEITVTNHGPSTARNIVVTDLLPEELVVNEDVTFADHPHCEPLLTTEASPVQIACTMADMLPGDSESVTLTVQLAEDYQGGATQLVNTAVVESDTYDPDEDNNEDTATVPLGEIEDPIVEVPPEAVPGETITVEGEGYVPGSTVIVEIRDPETGDVIIRVEVDVDDDGRFTVDIQLPPGLEPGDYVVVIIGDVPDVEEPDEQEEPITVLPPQITVPDVAQPGDEIIVEGENLPPGEEVIIIIRDPETGEPIVEVPVIVDEDGTIEVPIQLPDDLEPGDYDVVIVDPDTDDVYTEDTITIIDPQIDVPDGPIQPGEEIIIGGDGLEPDTDYIIIIRDPDTGEPILEVPVRTDEDGRFEVEITIPPGTDPGDYVVQIIDPSTGEVMDEDTITVVVPPVDDDDERDEDEREPTDRPDEDREDDPSRDDDLAVTGATVGTLALIALGLLALGAAVYLVNRRRNS